jgi:hypothetical protein
MPPSRRPRRPLRAQESPEDELASRRMRTRHSIHYCRRSGDGASVRVGWSASSVGSRRPVSSPRERVDVHPAKGRRHAQATAAAGARIRRYGDRRIDRSWRHFAGCRSTGRLRAPLTIPPSGTTFSTATSRSDVLTTRLLEDALARKSLSPESPIRPRCVLAPAPVAAPKPAPKHSHPRDIGPGELPALSRPENSEITSPR